MRRMVASDDIPLAESDTAVGMPRFRSDVAGIIHHHHPRHGFSEGLAEVCPTFAFSSRNQLVLRPEDISTLYFIAEIQSTQFSAMNRSYC